MSKQKLLLLVIQSTEDPEFDKVASLYLREVDGIQKIFNCNGPYDSGLDIRSVSVTEIEVQYQITTTKATKFDGKLKIDLLKASENVKKYGLPNKVKYFYSHPLTTAKILGYKKYAKDNFDIRLDIIDASAIADVADYYDEIRLLLRTLGDFDAYRDRGTYFKDNRVKAFYDLMTFGSSTDIKYNIVKSFVLFSLIESKCIAKEQLLKNINTHFNAQFETVYFDGFLRKMSSERRVTLHNDNVELTSTERERLDELLIDYHDEEAMVQKVISEILERYKINNAETESIIMCLCKLYENNYSINLGEFTTRETKESILRKATDEFKILLNRLVSDDKLLSDKLAKELLEACDNNDFLSRIAIGRVYSSVSEPDRLQEYITRHNNNKYIFLDTNIIIMALCVFYNKDIYFDDYQYKIAKQLLDFTKENNLKLATLKTYSMETAEIFREATRIIPFSRLAVFDALGGSKNVLYRFFNEIRCSGQLNSGTHTFEDFLREYHIELKSNPIAGYYRQIDWLLNQLDIDVETPKTYDLVKAKDLIYSDLKTPPVKNKSALAVSNDAIMLMRLGDTDVDVNPIDPMFCTWDMSLFRVRKEYFQEFPDCTEWMMYTPARLMNHFSMMNFHVRQGTLSNEVLSILDVDFNFQRKAQALLDSMLVIINPQNEVGLRYVNTFAEIRQNEILQVSQQQESSIDNISDNSSVDVVFEKLFINYNSKSDEDLFESFKSVFTKEELFDDVFSILNKEIASVKSNGQVTEGLFIKFDSIIESSRKV